ENPVKVTVFRNFDTTDENGQKCTITRNSEIELLGRAYNEYSGHYFFKSEKCSGLIRQISFMGNLEFDKENKKGRGAIRDLDEVYASKKRKIEEETEGERRLDCEYIRNKIDLFDQVRVISLAAKPVTRGVAIPL